MVKRVLVVIPLLASACVYEFPDQGAVATETSEGDGDGDDGETGTDASSSGDGDGDSTSSGDGDGDATSSGDGDGDPATGDGDGDGDPTSSGDGDSGPEPDPPCAAETSCGNAPHIGTVKGESADEPLMLVGNNEGWYWFDVEEADNDALDGEAMKLTVQLAGPDAVDYDLEVYRAQDAAGVPCGNNQHVSDNIGSSETIKLQWGEGDGNNSSDDTRTFAVHVISKTETCDPDASWTLTVAGASMVDGYDASEGQNGGWGKECAPPLGCDDAMSIGSFFADDFGSSVIAYGDTDAWVRFRAKEGQGGLAAHKMRVDVRLFGSPDTNYDIFVYQGNNDGDGPCGKNERVGNEPTSEEFVQSDWGEQNSTNFEDDSRNFVVHVVNADQVCDPKAIWTLVATGDL